MPNAARRLRALERTLERAEERQLARVAARQHEDTPPPLLGSSIVPAVQALLNAPLSTARIRKWEARIAGVVRDPQTNPVVFRKAAEAVVEGRIPAVKLERVLRAVENQRATIGFRRSAGAYFQTCITRLHKEHEA